MKNVPDCGPGHFLFERNGFFENLQQREGAEVERGVRGAAVPGDEPAVLIEAYNARAARDAAIDPNQVLAQLHEDEGPALFAADGGGKRADRGARLRRHVLPRQKQHEGIRIRADALNIFAREDVRRARLVVIGIDAAQRVRFAQSLAGLRKIGPSGA